MSGLDLFAMIVLLVMAASTIVVICVLGWLPGHIARDRGHPWSDAVRVAGWVTLFLGFALWPVVLIWAFVDIPASRKTEAVS